MKTIKILFCHLFKSYTAPSISRALRKLGVETVEKTYYTPEDSYRDTRLQKMLENDIRTVKPDVVLSVNYWGVVARSCKRLNLRYLSWSYDSPQNLPTDETMDYETNAIFLFDREEVSRYQSRGINTVHHLLLATDTEHWDALLGKDISYRYDVSLLGQFYESLLPNLTEIMTDYDRGMIEAYVAAQQKIYGYYMLDELITDELVNRVNSHYKSLSETAIQISEAQLSYAIATYITRLDRLTLTQVLNAETVSGVDYETEMPRVFRESKINLNPCLRAIRSGIPLRALDIMGCGGFLLSSYQSELAEHFENGVELVLYDSLEDAVEKTRYYLQNDDARREIARNGYEKVKRDFRYEDRLNEMFAIAGLL